MVLGVAVQVVRSYQGHVARNTVFVVREPFLKGVRLLQVVFAKVTSQFFLSLRSREEFYVSRVVAQGG